MSSALGAAIHLLSPIDRSFLDYVETGNVRQVINLLKEHPEVNINAKTGKGGKTALYAAVELGNEDLVQVLLKYGADPRIPTDGNQTPLQLAKKKDDTFIAADLEKVLAKFQQAKGATQDLYKAEDKIQDAIKILQQARGELQEALNSILVDINALPIDTVKKKELAHNIRKLAEDSALTASAGYFAFDVGS